MPGHRRPFAVLSLACAVATGYLERQVGRGDGVRRRARVPVHIPLGLAPLDLLFHGRRGFVPALNARDFEQVAYGTTINASYNHVTGLEQSTLLFRGAELFLGTVAGIEGTDAPLRLTAEDLSGDERPTFALPSGIIDYVVDDRTGVILANGIRLPR
jgi:hypothetical protein